MTIFQEVWVLTRTESTGHDITGAKVLAVYDCHKKANEVLLMLQTFSEEDFNLTQVQMECTGETCLQITGHLNETTGTLEAAHSLLDEYGICMNRARTLYGRLVDHFPHKG